jgi:hypothetical protein
MRFQLMPPSQIRPSSVRLEIVAEDAARKSPRLNLADPVLTRGWGEARRHGAGLASAPQASGVGGSTFVSGKPRPAHLTSPNARMTSQEIADLVGARHDNVKRAIERLAERGVISLSPVEEVKIKRER